MKSSLRKKCSSLANKGTSCGPRTQQRNSGVPAHRSGAACGVPRRALGRRSSVREEGQDSKL